MLYKISWITCAHVFILGLLHTILISPLSSATDVTIGIITGSICTNKLMPLNNVTIGSQTAHIKLLTNEVYPWSDLSLTTPTSFFSNEKQYAKNNLNCTISEYNYYYAILSNVLNQNYYLIQPQWTSTFVTPSPNMFIFPPDDYWLAKAVLAVMQNSNIAQATLMHYQFARLNTFLYMFQGLLIRTIDISNSASLYDTVTSDATFYQTSNQQAVILILPDNLANRTQIIISITDACIRSGQIAPKFLWLIPSLYLPTDVYNSYPTSLASTIITFQWNATANGVQIQNAAQSIENNCALAFKSCLASMASVSIAQGNAPLSLKESISLSVSFSASRMLSQQQFVLYGTFPTIPGNTLEAIGSITLSSSTSSIIYNSGGYNPVGIGTIRVLVIVEKPYYYYANDAINSTIGFLVDLFAELTVITGVQFSFHVYPKGISINDQLLALTSGSVDIIGRPMFPSTERRRPTVIYSRAVLSTKTAILALKPTESLVLRLIYILSPFSLWVWLFIAFFIIIMSLALFCIDKISPNINDKQPNGLTLVKCWYSIITYSMIVKSQTVHILNVSSKAFFLFFWLACIIIVAYYAAAIVNVMLRKDVITLPITLQSVWNNRYTNSWTFLQNSPLPENMRIKESLGVSNYTFYTYATTNWPKTMYSASYDTLKLPTDVILIGYYDGLYQANFDPQCRFYTNSSSGNISEYFDLSLAMSTNIQKLANLNNAVQTIFDNGWISAAISKWFIDGSCVSNVNFMLSELDIYELASLFFLQLAAIVVAFLIILIEYIIGRAKVCCLLMRERKLEMGKIYEANIALLEQDGIWISIPKHMHKYFMHTSQLHDNYKSRTTLELDLAVHDVITVKYFGNDPNTGAKRFMKVIN